MIHQKIAALLNEQINKELYSAYLYWDMSHHFEFNGLDGFANWYMVQAQEERDHALIFYRYLVDNNIPVELKYIEQPKRQYSNILDVLNNALDHEKHITESINKIYCEAIEQRDLGTMEFLNWFIKEQREEETNAHDMISKLENFGSDNQGLYLLNQEFSKRHYEKPDFD